MTFAVYGETSGFHIYDTETEAQTAANFLGCMGTHTHIIKGKKIWMPCHMN